MLSTRKPHKHTVLKSCARHEDALFSLWAYGTGSYHVPVLVDRLASHHADVAGMLGLRACSGIGGQPCHIVNEHDEIPMCSAISTTGYCCECMLTCHRCCQS